MSYDRAVLHTEPTNSLKISIKNNKEGTPVNIFHTYMKDQRNTMASPIPVDSNANDFYDVETVDDLFDFNKN